MRNKINLQIEEVLAILNLTPLKLSKKGYTNIVFFYTKLKFILGFGYAPFRPIKPKKKKTNLKLTFNGREVTFCKHTIYKRPINLL